MAETVVYVSATRDEVRKALMSVPKVAVSGGAGADPIMARCGLTALGRIRRAFIEKARGGTDEAGERWQPLSPATIAYRRRHPGVPGPKVRAAFRPSWALTNSQRDNWWSLYAQGLAMFKGAKSSAAKRAWAVLKTQGAQTLISKYGNAEVDILRDTGLLLSSLSPGVGIPEQIFRIGPGEVIVGTNRRGALQHHEGVPGRLPQRRLWPPPNKWPSSWWVDIAEQARAGLLDLAILLVRSA